MEYLFLIASALLSRGMNLRGRFARRPVRRILVFKLDHLGDLVTATPALAHLRRTWPGAEITLVVGPWSAPLVEHDPAVDRLIPYASPRYARGTAPAPGRSLRETLPGRPYDLVVGLRDDRASLAFALVSGASRRLDRGTVRLGYAWRRTAHRIGLARDPGPMHEVETNLRIAGAGRPGPDDRPRLVLPPAAGENLQRKVPALADPGAGYLVVHPGAYSPLRKWPADRFAAVLGRVVAEKRLRAFITGSEEEAGEALALARASGPGVESLAGRLSLLETAALIAGARAMLTVDTGLMHVATAVGTRVVALVGPEDPERFGPFGRGHVTIYHALPCSPCDQVSCRRERAECMEAITVDEVLAALDEVLGE